jgi:serine/threonine protein kinase
MFYKYIKKKHGSIVIYISGHQPLSWTARTQIALDAARGIEYIHDHTKACYVHRDIKTSNILLDNGLRAKASLF